MRNAENKLAGTIVVNSIDDFFRLGWVQNSSQRILPTSRGFVCGNRAVTKRGNDYFVTGKKGKKVSVKKIGENKYEVI